MSKSASDRLTIPPKPRPIRNFVIDRETLSHLPPIHKCAAEVMIKTGRWRLVE